MPNIKSAKKRVKVIKRKTLANRMYKSGLKTSLKKAEAAITQGDPASAGDVYRTVQRDIDRAAARGILHKNAAARRKSRLAIMAKAAEAQ
ncbi:MAG: 30S ribosomal protein S20 [Oscillospiraceae bacterium]|nr:30S ribosomal protein S20 [Oscillospiraceae bacterium]